MAVTSEVHPTFSVSSIILDKLFVLALVFLSFLI